MPPTSPSFQNQALPGSDLITAAARAIVAQEQARLPNLAALTILLPNLHAAKAMERALADAAGLPTLLLPKLTTLRNLAAEVLPDCGLLPDSQRGAMLYQALRDRGWFRQTDLWQATDDLARLMDELTRYRVALPASLDEFVRRLEQAYRAKAGASLQFEARLVHELWYAMNRGTDGRADSAAYYHLQLAQVAAGATGPLYGVGLDELTPAETEFLESYTTRQPVLLLGRAALPDDHPDPVASLLAAAWATQGPHSTPGAEPVAADLRSRALAFRERHATSPLQGRLALFGAHSPEQEAQAVDTQVRHWLLQGVSSIAVVVQDRLVARRTRALLERAQVLVRDETGWTFSTVAASTVVMRWLDTLTSRFFYQELLDFLKSPFVCADWPTGKRKQAVYELERLVRSHGVVAQLEAYRRLAQKEGAGPDTGELLARLDQARAGFSQRQRTLGGWLATLWESLDILGVLHGLAGDAAGAQLLQLLQRLQRELGTDGARFSLSEWRQWLNQQLEAATFRDESIQSPVAFTHLTATRLRCFDAVIVLGADAAHLPGQGQNSVFFNQGVRAQLGLPTIESSEHLLCQDLQALLSGSPRVLVTWQQSRNAEPNLLSPFFERLEALHRLAYGTSLLDENFAAVIAQAIVKCSDESIAESRCAAPSPQIPPQRVPSSLSASGYNSLMACPYQFYGRHVLRLNELDEVQLELEKKDFGEFVHLILHRFHAIHPNITGLNQPQLEQELATISNEVFAAAVDANYLSHAWLLRWLAIVPAYLDWQTEREAQGWRWLEGEAKRQSEISLEGGHTLTLKGRLDRVDQHINGACAVLDYKTQTREVLRKKLAEPGEDVQLPVYAALFGEPLAQAAFVALAKEKLGEVEAAQDLSQLSAAVVQRVVEIFDAMHDGAGLPAQGNEAACQYCEMRGLCRKDYWQ
jgi:ATP-dependent helicase/nuclease subunit B